MIKKVLIISSICILASIAWHYYVQWSWTHQPIKVGILQSLTGPLADHEKNLVDIELMAIDELNSAGGLLGRKIVSIIADGKSDEFEFAQQAERLITIEKVDVIVGCWTSSSRKAVKEIIEKHKSLLLYPVRYEGAEESNNIFYTGATPNQQTIPAATWCFNNLGKRFFLMGNDYIFPYTIHKILKLHIASLGGEVVGESFVKVEETVTASLIQEILKTQPQVICSTLDGNSNVTFFKELLNAGVTPEKIPTMSFSMGEPEIQHVARQSVVGAYTATTYYQRMRNTENLILVKNFKKQYGQNRTINDAMCCAYSLVHMWAMAVKSSKTTKIETIITTLKSVFYQSPSGLIYFDNNNHIWQSIFICKVDFEGQLIAVWDTGNQQIRPEPFPPYLTKKEWLEFLNGLYEQWGKRWSIA